jgi:hypothetical protein
LSDFSHITFDTAVAGALGAGNLGGGGDAEAEAIVGGNVGTKSVLGSDVNAGLGK